MEKKKNRSNWFPLWSAQRHPRQRGLVKKWEKLKQRIERKQAKWEKRKANRKASRGDGDEGGSLWASLAFILGIIFLAVGIILGIAAFSNPLGGFFHLLAALLVITGIILILYTALHSSGA